MHLWDNVLKWLASVMICFPPDISSFGSVLERLSLTLKGSNLKNKRTSKACFATALSHNSALVLRSKTHFDLPFGGH